MHIFLACILGGIIPVPVSIGRAEGSLAVSFPIPGEEIRAIRVDLHHFNIGKKIKESNHEATNLKVVEVGSPIPHCSVRITDADHHVKGDDTIGYIEIKGDNVTSGYYNNQEATAKVMREDGWLNTGDLELGKIASTGVRNEETQEEPYY